MISKDGLEEGGKARGESGLGLECGPKESEVETGEDASGSRLSVRPSRVLRSRLLLHSTCSSSRPGLHAKRKQTVSNGEPSMEEEKQQRGLH